jgi:hypothetical protein
LGLAGQTQVLPALTQEAENDLHFAGAVDAQANGAVVEVLGNKNVVPLSLAFDAQRIGPTPST